MRMQEEAMISVDHLTVKYKLSNDRVKSIKEYLIALLGRKLKVKEFTALQDIHFTLRRGAVLGVIGNNGAGKSTLLKVISRILKPAEGTVTLRGNVVPMLELGSGFDFDLTGRENIFLSGAILGYDKRYLEDNFQKIADFSELGEFIETPLRNYSSGMLMRLAFSVASVINPEILIVDEILAVGDANFQEKSKARMLELMSGGTTVLFVSHSLLQIRELCDQVIWLEHGVQKMIGPTREVCDAYERSFQAG